jgi:hypothetical protein
MTLTPAQPNAFAKGSVNPTITGLTSANYPIVSGPLNASNTFGIGTLALQQTNASASAQTYTSSLTYNLAAPVAGTYNLLAGLLEPVGGSFATGPFTLTFGITEGATVLEPTQTFTSLAAANAFFSDDLLNLGAQSGNITGLTVSLGLTTAGTVGDGLDFVLGFTPAGNSVPEPGTLAIFLSALLGWFGIKRYRQQKPNGGAQMA